MNYSEYYQSSIKDTKAFWEERAKEIKWFEEPLETLSKDEENLYHWFKGGKINTSYLAIDQHIENGKGDQKALIYDSPVTGAKKSYTFHELKNEVELVAGMLTKLGVQKGDRVIIYMPMIPETTFAMLACARIGAIHSVVFGGFAAHELAIRIDDAEPKVILCASGGKETDKIIPYKPVVDNAIESAKHKVENVVILQRDFVQGEIKTGRDHDWMELRSKAEPQGYVILDATDPLYILYTSGTTGKPKGIIRENGGHAVAMKFSMNYVYGMDEDGVFWAGSDYGWVVGHSYIVYAPLIHGCTTVVYEGKPIGTPDAGAFWHIIQDYKVNIFFTAPTAFRAIRKMDPNAELKKKYDLSSLKKQFLAGERCDASTLNWLQEHLQIPVIDHWWQTESGFPMISQMTSLEIYPIKPGSSGKAVAGFEFKVVDEEGQELGANEEGKLVIKYPLPPGALPNLWNDTDRFKKDYLEPVPGYYLSGDGGYKDEDEYIFITGRIDDVINIAGHRMSTAEFEEVLATHAAVSECAVVGAKDSYKGQIPVGLAVLKSDVTDSWEKIEKELIQLIRDEIGPVASFKIVKQVKKLPKTRSGKILRKTIRAIADKKEYKMPSTIEDPDVLKDIEAIFK